MMINSKATPKMLASTIMIFFIVLFNGSSLFFAFSLCAFRVLVCSKMVSKIRWTRQIDLCMGQKDRHEAWSPCPIPVNPNSCEGIKPESKLERVK